MTAPEPEPPNDDREWLLDLLPTSAHKYIDAILKYFAPQAVAAVEVIGARAAVDRVEVAGLEIGVDANGRAATVRFPDEAEVTEWGNR